MRYHKQWKLVHKKTGEVKTQGSYRQCSITWETLSSDDYTIQLVLPIANVQPTYNWKD